MKFVGEGVEGVGEGGRLELLENLCFTTLNIFVYVHEYHYPLKEASWEGEERTIYFIVVCHSRQRILGSSFENLLNYTRELLSISY